MKKLLLALAFLPMMAQSKHIAIAPSGMMGMTVLTNEPCTYNKTLLAAYAYNQNKTIIYACWKLDGENVVFSNSYPQLIKIPVKQFIEAPKLNDPS
jgi:hypothetical protein